MARRFKQKADVVLIELDVEQAESILVSQREPMPFNAGYDNFLSIAAIFELPMRFCIAMQLRSLGSFNFRDRRAHQNGLRKYRKPL